MPMITAIGNYTGGHLLYWADDDMNMSLEDMSQYEPQVIDLRDQVVFINGKCAHAVEAFEVTRYSIVPFLRLFSKMLSAVKI